MPDFIVGAIWVAPKNGGNFEAGAAYVYSGRDGSLLYQKDGDSVDINHLGLNVAFGGDMNGDGKSEFIVGSYASTYVYSGAAGNLLYQYTDSGGEPNGLLAELDDVNGDGKSDFAIGNPYSYPDPRGSTYFFAGKVTVYSGIDGSVLHILYGDTAFSSLGYSIAGIGDVDGDGFGDLIVGSQETYRNNVSTDIGAVSLYSGKTGTLIRKVYGRKNGVRLGWAVAGMGDVSGDGIPDFMSSTPYDSNGAAYVFSGATGDIIYANYFDKAFRDFGYSCAAGGDIDGDNKPDFFIGARFDRPPNLTGEYGAAYAYSGATGTLIFFVYGDSAEDRLGWSLAGCGDLNGDGRTEFITGAPSACIWGQYPYSGGIWVYGFPAPRDTTLDTAILVVHPTSLRFESKNGGSPQTDTVYVENAGKGDYFWYISGAIPPWFSLAYIGGVTPGKIILTANPAGLRSRMWNAAFDVVIDGTANSPQTVKIQLKIGGKP